MVVEFINESETVARMTLTIRPQTGDTVVARGKVWEVVSGLQFGHGTVGSLEIVRAKAEVREVSK